MKHLSLIGLDVEQKLEVVRDAFEAESYKFLNNKYKNSKQKLKFICPEGHKGSISWNLFRSGKRCMECEDIQFRLEMNLEREKKDKVLSKITIEEVRTAVEADGFTLLLETYSYPQELLIKCPKGHLVVADVMLSEEPVFENGQVIWRACIRLHYKTRSSFIKCRICDHINRHLSNHNLKPDEKALLYFISVEDIRSGKIHPKFGFTTDFEKRFKYPGSNFRTKVIDSFEGLSFDILGLEKMLMIATEPNRIDYDGDALKGFGGRSECGRAETFSSYRKAWDKIVPRKLS